MSVIPAVAIIALTTVKPIRLIAVTRCALSAHNRPTLTTLSNWLSFPRFASCAAARNRAIFCCADSPAGTDAPKVNRDADEAGCCGFEAKSVLLAA